MSKKRIAVIAGDGIGKEVMPEGIRVMEAAASKFGIDWPLTISILLAGIILKSTAR
jgi:isocitrate/isopropylmalate dehydrogenase